MFRHLESEKRLTALIRVGSISCLAGWTWAHFYWSSPIDILLWNEFFYSLSTSIGYDWDDWIGTGANDGIVATIIYGIAWLLLLCTIASFTTQSKSTYQLGFLWLGAFILSVISYSLFLDAKRQLPMFIEHGGQMLIPIILYFALTHGIQHKITERIALVACIMTFAGHGCYAINLWPTPGNFSAMTTVILDFDHTWSKNFLYAVGTLDFIVCIGFFYKKWRVTIALYAALWGLATAIARPLAGMSSELIYFGADQYLHQLFLRAPHFIIPLYLAILWKKTKNTNFTEKTKSLKEREQKSLESNQVIVTH